MNVAAKYKILLIDDDVEFAKVIKFRLHHSEKPRFEVHSTGSCRSAAELLAAQRFDLILLDLMLPNMDRSQVVSNMLSISGETPIVVMTGLDDDSIAVEAVRKGAQDFIVKGEITPKMLIRVILHAIERHQISKKLRVVTGKLRQVNAQLEKYALLDPLTDVYNRRGLQQALTREIHASERKGTSLLALVMDIDDFKKVNDTLGHPSGDIVLKEISKKIRESVRISDYVGRIGGDEFILLLPETSMEEGIKLAERLRLSISGTRLHVAEGRDIRITVSVGLAPVSMHVCSVDEILGLTDPLLMESKTHGKNRIFYESSDAAGSSAKRPSSMHLPDYLDSLRRGEHFFAVKQPIHNLRDGSVVGVEMLTRMRHRVLGMPSDFFRAAIENNMVTLVDHHCFNTCLASANMLSEARNCHINLLPSTMIDIPVAKLIERLAGNGRQNYCLEISEQQLIGEPSHLTHAVKMLKRSGIKIAMDDVGFGNTCLENLFFLEPDIIKIDKKCVMGIAYQPAMQRTLQHLMRLADDLGSTVIAEGIETREDLEMLIELGIEQGQGYYLSMPS